MSHPYPNDGPGGRPPRDSRGSFGAGSEGYGGGRDRVPPPREYPSHGAGGYGGRGGYERDYPRPPPQREREMRDTWEAGRDGPAAGYVRGRAPPPWEDDYDRPKRRRSPSPSYAAHRPRHRSPSPGGFGGPMRTYPPPPRDRDAHGHGGAGAGSRYPVTNADAAGPGPVANLNAGPNAGPGLGPGAGPSLPDPASLEYLLSFRAFSDWFRSSHPSTAKADEDEYRAYKAALEAGTLSKEEARGGKEKVGMLKRYARYRKEFTSRQLYSLFLSHRDSAWFREKYGNGEQEKEARERSERLGRGRESRRYVQELGEGKWDDVSFDAKDDPTTHETPALDRPLTDTAPTDGEPLRIEVPPKAKQVFVKTVPPTIGRADLEAFFSQIDGFEYLALTEPSVKKAFHRVAWAQFADGVDIGEVVGKLDGQKIDNFTLHMGANTAPTVGRLRATHGIANTLPRLRRDAELAKQLAIRLEEGFMKPDEEDDDESATDDAPAPAPAPAAASANPSESAEKEPAGAADADAPSADTKAGAEGTQDDAKPVPGSQEDGSGDGKDKQSPVDIADEGWHAPHDRPSDVVQSVIDRLVAEKGLDGEEGEMSHEQLVQRAKLTVDQWVSYLRNGLQTCYYCVAPMGFPEELQRKCIGHVRSAAPAPAPSAPAEAEGEADVEGADDAAPGGDVEMDGGHGGEKKADADRDADAGEPKPDADPVADTDMDNTDMDNERERRDDERGPAHDRDRDHEDEHAHRRDASYNRDRDQHPNQKTNEEKWEEGLERKIAPLIGEVDILDYYGKDIEDETRRLTAPYIKQEEASKYRCKECSKLFKAPSFVIKHVVAKHGELVGSTLNDYGVFNNFVLDPQHLSPTNTTPAAVDDRLPPASVSQNNMGMGMPLNLGVPAFNPANLPQGEGMQQQQQQMMVMMMQMQQAMMMQMSGQSVGAHGGTGNMAGAAGGRRLQDRMGGYANDNMSGGRYQGSYSNGSASGGGIAAGDGVGNGNGAGLVGSAGQGRMMGTQIGTPGKEDPRAKRGRVSYQDLDEVGGGEGGGLPY